MRLVRNKRVPASETETILETKVSTESVFVAFYERISEAEKPATTKELVAGPSFLGIICVNFVKVLLAFGK